MLSGLAWTDLIGQFAVSPIAIIAYANNLRWIGGTELCRYHGFMMVSFGLVMPLIVCCMSVERLLAIKFSYYYAKHVTRRKAQCTFLGCWCVTTLFSALPFLGFGSYELQFPRTWCFLNFHRESKVDSIYAALFGSFNIIAIIIMILCNLIVAGTLFSMRRSRQLNSSPSVDRRLSTSGLASTASGTIFRTRRHSDMEAQMIWFLCLITVAFSVCWLPLNVHILIMQFAGTNNKVLDLKVIRMASCNQILDPWLYVIFRKNSLLRIIRRLKACINAVQQVPRQASTKVPKMRYIISNKSFTYEASSLVKTHLAGPCCINDPNMGKHVAPTDCEQTKKQDCSCGSSDSNARLMSACSYCDCDCRSRSVCNLIPDLVHDRSQHTDVKPNCCDFPDNTFKCCKCECAARKDNVEQPYFGNTCRGLSEPFIDTSSKPKRMFKTFLSGLDNSVSSDLNGAYYSLDSTHHPPVISMNSSKTKKMLSSTGQLLPFKRSPKHGVNSASIYSEVARPHSLAILNSASFLLLPSLTSPQRLVTPRHEEQDNISTHSSCTANFSTCPANIPFLLENIPESLAPKGNGHMLAGKKSQPNCSGVRSYSNLQRTPTDTHLYKYKQAIDNSSVYSKDDIYLSLRGADTVTRWPTYHNMKMYNFTVTGFSKEDIANIISGKRLSCPHKTKSTFSSKLFSFGTTSQNSKNPAMNAGAKLCNSSSLLQCVDHSDHIKCFKAKKTTPHQGRNGTAAYITDLQNQANGCKHSFLDVSVGSCP
ncbi:unnamed protein product [Candidula unifasciata]|uniref:G-protein coupled receptors family 1 profile domain-containing protein n=1 Tax=Candidula unifasciata TaxID=100452 RepID=A0A8S3YPX1_9EUPU|nr:unnamed protein product [Candidula unifasciata]